MGRIVREFLPVMLWEDGDSLPSPAVQTPSLSNSLVSSPTQQSALPLMSQGHGDQLPSQQPDNRGGEMPECPALSPCPAFLGMSTLACSPLLPAALLTAALTGVEGEASSTAQTLVL